MVIAVILAWPAAAAASAVVELTGGVTGFSSDMGPEGITVGADGHIWFTEFLDPGGIALVNSVSVSDLYMGGSR
jgi:hypothetical protein